MRFAGLQKTSLIDYPDRVASILFTSGCNLRCPFCHNGELVHDYTGPFLEEDEALCILLKRKKYVDSVVITGGEPTLQPDLPEFLCKLKEKGFHVKLDTNGLKPDALKACLPYLDYVAMDVKTSPSKYVLLGAENIKPVKDSIDIIMFSGVDYEFRCTAVPGLVEKDMIHEIGELVKGAGVFVFQQYRPEKTLDPSYGNIQPHSDEKLQSFANLLEEFVDDVRVR